MFPNIIKPSVKGVEVNNSILANEKIIPNQVGVQNMHDNNLFKPLLSFLIRVNILKGPS